MEDESLLEDDTVIAIVQANGKLRAKIEVPVSISEEDLRALALEQGPIVKLLEGREPLRVIVRAPQLVNIVLPK